MAEGSGSQRFCGNCGTEIRTGTSFCVSCGKSVNGGPASPGPDNSVPPPTPPRSLADTLKEIFRGLTERVSNARSASSGASLSGLPNRAINWLKDLPSVPKLILAGVILLFVTVLLSPVIFFVGLAMMLVGIAAVVINLIRRKPFKKWGVGTGMVVVLTLIVGIISNVTYNTNHLWGIGYELSEEEQNYLNSVDTYQQMMLENIDEQATLTESYPNITAQQIELSDGVQLGNAFAAEGNAKNISVPSGCEEHHEVWTTAMKKLVYSAFSASDYMRSGNSDDERFVRIFRNQGFDALDEANRILDRIERQGCGG